MTNNTTGHIKNAWKAYKNNWTSLIGGMIIAGLIPMILVAIGGIPFALSAVTYFTGGGTDVVGFFMDNMATGGIAVTMFILAAIISVILNGGYLKMCHESLRGKTKIGTMFDTAKQKWATILVAVILVAIINSAISYILSLTVVLIPLTFIVPIIFTFTLYAVIIDNMGAWDSIKHSVKFVKNNIIGFLVLTIVLVIATTILLFIPLVGWLAILFVMAPIILISYVSFYVKGKKVQAPIKRSKRRRRRRR